MIRPPAARPPLLERYASFAVRRRWTVLGAWVAGLVAVVGVGVAFGGEFSDNFEVPGTEAQHAIDLLGESFPAQAGGTADLVFRAEGGASIADARVATDIRAAYDAVAAVPGVIAIDTHFDNPPYVASGGTIARAVVRWAEVPGDIGPEATKEYLDVVDSLSTPSVKVETGGPVVAFNEGAEPNSEMIGLIAAAVILVIAFGTLVAAGVPIGMAVFGLGAAFGCLFLLANTGFVPSFAPAFAAMIGIGVGIDYALLVVTRYREGLHTGLDVHDAVVSAVSTSGRSVIFAGAVVAVSFLGLSAMGLPFVTALGFAGAIVVAWAVLVALTLLPAVLAIAGTRIDSLRIPLLHTREGINERSAWFRLSRAIQRRPWPYFAGSTAVVVLLMSPLLDLNLGVTDDGNRSDAFHSRRAYDLLAEGFGPGFNAPITVVASSPGVGAVVDSFREAAAAHANVVDVSTAFVNQAGDTAVFTIIPGTRPQSGATTELIHDLRRQVFPPVEDATGTTALVTGSSAAFADISDRISGRIGLLFVGVIGISFLLLTAVFRSLVVAAKAAILNLMSIGAAFGVLIAVFQWGWLGSLIGVEAGPIETFLPMMLFAILFGLSMDYEVFLISRIREEYVRSGSNSQAVANGLAVTARVITAAAAIMCFVFFGFALGDDRVIKLFGIGLGSAILVDATVIRLILVPSTMALLGNANWWLPSWLDRLLPDLNIEGRVRGEAGGHAPAVEPEVAGGGR